MRLLLAEDDFLLADGLQCWLAEAGYTVDWVQDGVAADLALEAVVYGGALLDWNLPRLSGLQVLARLRGRGMEVPVLMISSRTEVTDRVRALDHGADDYVVKPFDLEELCARLRALQRRCAGQADPLLCHGVLRLDQAARSVTLAGEPVVLSRREFALLHVLLQHAGRVQTRERLEEALYGWDEEVESNALEVHIHHLRRKLGTGLIQTVRGCGYFIPEAA